jgi:bacteriocin-like protein
MIMSKSKPEEEKQQEDPSVKEVAPTGKKELTEEQLNSVSGGGDPQVQVTD